jgi:hypothetical protein
MPGSISNAAPSTVMPWSLCKAFVRSMEFPVLDNEYKNGESQRSRLADTSRKTWKLSMRLTPTLLGQLRDFWDARNGPHQPFYFYDPFETSPEFSYDPTGTSLYGRYPVRFDGAWSQTVGLARIDVEISLVQLA